jgi:hypothetical protein
MAAKENKNKGMGKLPANVVKKNIQIRCEHMHILKQEANDRFEGNLSMLIRHILDWYIESKSDDFSDAHIDRRQ